MKPVHIDIMFIILSTLGTVIAAFTDMVFEGAFLVFVAIVLVFVERKMTLKK